MSTPTPPTLPNLPDLPPVNWASLGLSPPVVLPPTHGTGLPHADVVVVTWAGAEWAAMVQVFVNRAEPMPYSAAHNSSWPGWTAWTAEMPPYTPPSSGSDAGETWNEWGFYLLVRIGTLKVLLLKSNTHLTWPGQSYLEGMARAICAEAKPRLLLSIGTAGGSRLTDKIGTVNVVNTGTFDNSADAKHWPVYANGWLAPWGLVAQPGFANLLFPIPVTPADLATLAAAYNQGYGTSYTLDQLDQLGLDIPDPVPAANNLTVAGTSLLTTSSFVVAETTGNFSSYACVEMDDALLAKECAKAGVAFGFVRNVSDPAQNPEVTPVGEWGSWLYDTYGLYTSFNGALVTAVMLMDLGS